MNDKLLGKETHVLALLSEIHKLLGDDTALADKIAEQIDMLPVGKDLRQLVITKRIRWSYYSEKCALELKPTLDAIIESRKPRQFLISEHPKMSVRTIYLKVYQPWMWLIDYHPDKELYKKLKEETRIAQLSNIGVRIQFNEAEAEPLSAVPVNEMTSGSIIKLQNKISDFLSQPILEDMLFDEKNLALSPDELNQIKDSLAGLPPEKVAINITADRVRILRKVT